MKLGFIGCVEFSRAALQRTIGLPGVELVGVVTQRCPGLNSDFARVDDVATAAGAPVLYADEADRIRTR